MNATTFVEGPLRDLRHAVRMLRLNPVFSLTVILTIALGIGATTTLFSVVNGVVIKPLLYPESEAVVTVTHSALTGGVRNDSFPFSPQMLETQLTHGRVFEELGIYRGGQATVTGVDEPEQVGALLVSAGTLRALQIQPALGRWFSPRDDSPGAPETVILSSGFWQGSFGGDPGVIGRLITVDGRPREVIGVMPAHFGLRGIPMNLILPLRIDLARPPVDFAYSAVARLGPGATVAEANADVARMLPLYIEKYGATPAADRALRALRLEPAVRPLKDDVVGNIGEFLWVLLGGISMLLVIACANVANLLLVRTETRAAEFAVRTALGAGRTQLASGLMVESLTLSLIGGLVGVGLAYAGLSVLLALQPANLPRLSEIAIDLNVLLFAGVMSVLSGWVFGLVPILQLATRKMASNVTQFVHGGGRWSSAGKHQQRLQNVLVVAQVALALVMLVSAGLMVRTFLNVLDVEPGFTDPATVQAVRVTLPDAMWAESERVAQTQAQILDRLAAIPGVTTAGYISELPMAGQAGAVVAAEDTTTEDGGFPPNRRIKWISPGVLQTLGTPLLTGRDFDWVEIYEQRNVVLVSEGFARETWNTVEGAVGKRVRVEPDNPWQAVIGVVADVYDDGAHLPAPPTVYWPAREHPYVVGNFVPLTVSFALRIDRTGTESLHGDIRQAVSDVAPDLPIAQVRTLAQVYDDSMARTSLSLVLLGIASAMALLLSIVGIYGVLAYAVMRRRREVGIRVACGATPRAVQRIFVYRGMLLSGLGIAVGAAAAAGLTQVMSSLLFGVAPIDGVTFAAAAGMLVVAALLASYLPARRAAALAPAETLRGQ